ncbi:ABC transporter substrate-binding protein [Methylobacterium nonmethylotrophicum]|nr:ABC transporter substrate-binding protein [Methylobacterium nonmethylotrophicum]
MDRRTFCVAGAWLAVFGASRASAAPRRVVLVGGGRSTDRSSLLLIKFIREGLADHGIVEGRDIEIEEIWADGDYKNMPKISSNALSRNPEAILVNTISGASAVKSLTNTIPIVMLSLNDPIRAGLAESLANPGGNITGVATSGEESLLKLLDIGFEAFPKIGTIAAISNPLNPSNITLEKAFSNQCEKRGATARIHRWDPSKSFPNFSDEIFASRPDTLIIMPDSALNANAKAFCLLAIEKKVGLLASVRQFAEEGALISYGYVHRDNVKRAIYFLKRVLEGEKAAKLPIEQPSRFELVINMRTARALDVDLPPYLLGRADEIME